MARSDAIGNTRTMTAIPPATTYHRWAGWHAPAMRRAVVVACIGLAVGLVLMRFAPWQLAVVAGWDAAALTFLMSLWPIILRADSSQAEQLATREDEQRGSATVLLLAASVVSLLGVGSALTLAGRGSGPPRVLLIGIAVLTVLLSWTVVNMVYTLHYAHRDFGSTARASPSATRGRRGPPTATSPTSPSRSACATRCPTRRCAIPGSGARCFPTPPCHTCSAW